MKRFKAAFKAGIKIAIIGLVLFVVGIIMLIVAPLVENSAILVIGFFIFGFSLCFFVLALTRAKQRLHAICPECEKYMGDTGEDVNYSFVCTQYKENYDRDNKFINFTCYYTCTIVCPHCGASSVFEYNLRAKNISKADELVNNYLKATLKLKK